jgi:hypothetical protein
MYCILLALLNILFVIVINFFENNVAKYPFQLMKTTFKIYNKAEFLMNQAKYLNNYMIIIYIILHPTRKKVH